MGLWYHPHYDPPGLAAAFQLTGLLPDRNPLLLGKLVERGIIPRPFVHASPLALFEELRLVHPEDYLEQVTQPATLQRIFGYPVTEDEADQLLRAHRRAVGGTVAAARAVVAGEVEIGINVGGGFHHAEAARGSGYCVFNDVAIAIASLRKDGYARPIAIVDLDFHQGNGNLRIFARDRSVLTYSLHGAVWDPEAGESNLELLLPPGATDEVYLETLKKTLPAALARHRPELIFYIAGNDVLAGDRLGTFALTPQGVLSRDRLVHECARALDASLIVALGGGYSPLSWQCTANFVSYLRKGRARARTDWQPDLRSRFSEIARSLEESGGTGGDSGLGEEAELLGDLGRLTRSRQFLDLYSEQGLEFAFEKYGILPKIRELGYSDIRLRTELADPDRQVLRLSSGTELLLELVVGRTDAPAPPWSGIPRDFRLLNVNWLLLQHPRAEFSSHHPRLPGQARPGLGIAEDVMELLVQACRRKELDGILSMPSHYHGAAIASRWAHFLDPLREGRLLAMRQVFFRFHLWSASEIVQQDGLRFADDTQLRWEPAPQVVPVSATMREYFESPAYRARALEECQRLLKAGLHVTAAALASKRA